MFLSSNFSLRNLLFKFILFTIFVDSKIIIGVSYAKVCMTILAGKLLVGLRDNPARVWRWDKTARDFVLLEALEKNGLLVCSVDFKEDIRGVQVRVAVDSMYPYVSKNEYKAHGYIGAIWNTLESELKFKSIFSKADASMGNAFMNGTHDVSLGAIAISSYRAGHYSYAHQIATNSYSLFTLSEGTRVSTWWYAKVFSEGLWIMTFATLMVIQILLFTMYRLKKAICYNYTECNNELSAPSFIFLCVLGGISGQGIQKIPCSWSLRCLVVTSLLMGVLISVGFSSTLTSHLAIKSSTVPISSLEEIATLRTYSLCLRIRSAPWFRFTINEEIDGPLDPKWKDIINTPNCPNMEDRNELKAKMCEPKLVYLESPEIFLPVYREVRHNCEIVKVTGDFWQKKISFTFATSWPYRKLINKYLLKFHSVGILSYFQNLWISREYTSNTEHKLDFQAVEQGHIKIILIGLCIMFVISTIICILEITWFRFQQSSEINKRKRKLQAHVQRRLKQWKSTTQLTQSLWI